MWVSLIPSSSYVDVRLISLLYTVTSSDSSVYVVSATVRSIYSIYVVSATVGII
jgi:hypothetical protein